MILTAVQTNDNQRVKRNTLGTIDNVNTTGSGDEVNHLGDVKSIAKQLKPEEMINGTLIYVQNMFLMYYEFLEYYDNATNTLSNITLEMVSTKHDPYADCLLVVDLASKDPAHTLHINMSGDTSQWLINQFIWDSEAVLLPEIIWSDVQSSYACFNTNNLTINNTGNLMYFNGLQVSFALYLVERIFKYCPFTDST